MPNANSLGVIYSPEPFWALAAENACAALRDNFEISSYPLEAQGYGRKAKMELANLVKQAPGRLLIFSPNPDLLPEAREPYIVFADATLVQRYWIQNHRPPSTLFKRRVVRVRQLAKSGHKFACFSMLAEHGVAEEYRVPLERIALVPFPIDVQTSYSELRQPRLPIRVLILSGQHSVEAQEFSKSCPEATWTSLADCLDMPASERARHLIEADLIVLFNDQETYSPLALEAMACGRPVVLENSGAASEIVRDAIDGVVSSREGMAGVLSAVRSYVAAPARLTAEGQAAYERVKSQHSYSEFAAKVANLLR